MKSFESVDSTVSKPHSPSSGQLYVPHALPGVHSMPNFGQFYGQYPNIGSYPMGVWPPFNPYHKSNGSTEHSQ